MALHVPFLNRLQGSLGMVFAFAGMVTLPAQTPDTWKGVALVDGGRLTGRWKPSFPLPQIPGQWGPWAMTEKMTRPEQLRQAVPSEANLDPDKEGRRILVVAPSAGLEGMVVDLGGGQADIRGAGLLNSMLRIGNGGLAVLQDSFLAGFHIIESRNESPGGAVIIRNCGITGAFGGGFISGSQTWLIRDSHFRGAQLPWVSNRPAHAPKITKCHFQDCFLPESFLLNCQSCTFDNCVIGSPEQFSKGTGRRFTFVESGAPSHFLPRSNAPVTMDLTKGPPAATFWGGWLGEDRTLTSACLMYPDRSIAVQLLSDNTGSAADLTAGTKSKVYRSSDGSVRLRLESDTLQIQELGQNQGSVPATRLSGRQVTWSQSFASAAGLDAEGTPRKPALPVDCRGFFTGDYHTLVVIGASRREGPPLTQVLHSLPAGLPSARERTTRAVGTLWEISGPSSHQLRIDTPDRLSWVGGSPAKVSGSPWRPLRTEGSFVIADWLGSPAEVRVDSALQSLRVTSGERVWEGTFISREDTQSLAELLPGSGTSSGKALVDVPRPADSPEPMSPAAPATTALKSPTSRINGLLVSVLGGGKTAGATSQMNAAAIPGRVTGEATLEFNQKIGPQMSKALEEVRKFQTIRHGSWPTDCAIEISFADKYTLKDGPSAAVACALLLEGLYTGQSWDSALAVTGDLNSDGSVQPVGGVPAKIRGALGRQCRLVGIPAGNERAMRDLLISDGPHVLMGINVFLLTEFDQARDLALTAKTPKLTEALSEFDKVLNAGITREKAPAWVKLPAVTTLLRQVLAAAPHHLSARLLLEYSEGRLPTTLSIAGSIEFINGQTNDVVAGIRETSNLGSLSGLNKDSLGEAVFRLRRIRGIMHPETRRLVDSIESYSTLVRGILASPPRAPAIIQKALSSISAAGSTVQLEYEKLRSNPEVVAELMKD